MEDILDRHPTDNVVLKIQDFDGPIELLYELLVRDGRYDIRTFPLAQITDQYLKHMEQVDELDMEEASEYIKIAAKLLEIKARACLPIVDEFDEDDFVDEDPEEDLRRKILMFQMCKQQAEKLKAREIGRAHV